eukprot:6685198-Prymnesium_polylepis.1
MQAAPVVLPGAPPPASAAPAAAPAAAPTATGAPAASPAAYPPEATGAPVAATAPVAAVPAVAAVPTVAVGVAVGESDDVPDDEALFALEEELPQEVGPGDEEANAKVDPMLHDVPGVDGP